MCFCWRLGCLGVPENGSGAGSAELDATGVEGLVNSSSSSEEEGSLSEGTGASSSEESEDSSSEDDGSGEVRLGGKG